MLIPAYSGISLEGSQINVVLGTSTLRVVRGQANAFTNVKQCTRVRVAQHVAEALLRSLPIRQGAPECLMPFRGQAVNPLAMPFTQSHLDQTLAAQRTEAAGQGLYGDILIACEVALRDSAALMQRFQNQKLRKSQTARSQYEVVEVGYCTARAAKCSASARQTRALVLVRYIAN